MSFWKSYAWDAQTLVVDLKQDRVSAAYKTNVFLVWMGVLYLGSLGASFDPAPKHLAVIETATTFLIFFASVRVCFKINQRADGKDFIGRYVSLALPLLVRFFFLSIAIALPVSCVMTTEPTPGQASPFTYFDTGWSIFLELVQFVWMRKYFLKLEAA